MRMGKDKSGQISIDFLIGITIFVLAFLFLMAAIPSMFTPFQSNSDELTMMADRVAATLTENTLAYQQTPTEKLPSIIDKNTFDNTYKSEFSLGNYNDLYQAVGLDRTKYHITIDLEQLQNGAIQTVDSITDGSSKNQNVGQSRRFVKVMDSSQANGGWPGTNGVLVVRVWQWNGT